MNNKTINVNTATYVGIDAHPTEHTAVVINRFEDEKGKLRFANTLPGIQEFLAWLPTIETDFSDLFVRYVFMRLSRPPPMKVL
jgi:hypothetical protein